MKKTVLAIWGQENQGKSTTIGLITKEFIKSNNQRIIRSDSIDFSNDFQLIINYNSYKIGIESQGDPNSRLFESLNLFVSENCDLIICSTRTHGATVDAVNDLKSKGYDVIWATNYRCYEKNKKELNEVSAKHIFSLIQLIINDKL